MTNKPVFDIKTSTYNLSIQLSLNGFSFCIASNERKIITYFEHQLEDRNYNEQELLENLKSIFNTKAELQASFKNIELIFQNELFSLVPNELFDKNTPNDYLKYSIKTLKTDFIAHDILKNTNIVNVFIPYVNINNFIIDTFGEFNYQHSSGLLVKYCISINNYSPNEIVYLHVNQQQFDICIIKNKQLLLFNSFIKNRNEDILYYLLFCMEQLNLSTEEIPLKLLTPVTTDLFDLIYTYIRNVEKSTLKQNNLLHKLALNI